MSARTLPAFLVLGVIGAWFVSSVVWAVLELRRSRRGVGR